MLFSRAVQLPAHIYDNDMKFCKFSNKFDNGFFSLQKVHSTVYTDDSHEWLCR